MKMFFLLGFLVFFSCKKDPIQYNFEGHITENYEGASLSEAGVTIYHKPLNNAISSNGFSFAGSAKTDINGSYSIAFDREKATEFKVNIQKEGFFKRDIVLGSADVSSENVNIVNARMDARSWVCFNIQNDFPANITDALTLIFYDFRKDCEHCIELDYNYLNGELDTALLFQNTGGEYLKFTYVDVAGSLSTTDSVYMTPFDTVFYSINY